MKTRAQLGNLSLPSHIDSGRLTKAHVMLNQGSQVNCNIDDDKLVQGIVKSQGDPGLVYACVIHLTSGRYFCATNNLKTCGGLRGAPCKHILVVLYALAMNDAITATDMYFALKATKDQKPQFDADLTKTLITIEQVKHRLQNKQWAYTIKTGD